MQRLQRIAQHVMHRRIIRIDGQRGFIGRNRFRVTIARVQHIGKVEMSNGVIGLEGNRRLIGLNRLCVTAECLLRVAEADICNGPRRLALYRPVQQIGSLIELPLLTLENSEIVQSIEMIAPDLQDRAIETLCLGQSALLVQGKRRVECLCQREG